MKYVLRGQSTPRSIITRGRKKSGSGSTTATKAASPSRPWKSFSTRSVTRGSFLRLCPERIPEGEEEEKREHQESHRLAIRFLPPLGKEVEIELCLGVDEPQERVRHSEERTACDESGSDQRAPLKPCGVQRLVLR